MTDFNWDKTIQLGVSERRINKPSYFPTKFKQHTFRKHTLEMCRAEANRLTWFFLKLHWLLTLQCLVTAVISLCALPAHRTEEFWNTEEFQLSRKKSTAPPHQDHKAQRLPSAHQQVFWAPPPRQTPLSLTCEHFHEVGTGHAHNHISLQRRLPRTSVPSLGFQVNVPGASFITWTDSKKGGDEAAEHNLPSSSLSNSSCHAHLGAVTGRCLCWPCLPHALAEPAPCRCQQQESPKAACCWQSWWQLVLSSRPLSAPVYHLQNPVHGAQPPQEPQEQQQLPCRPELGPRSIPWKETEGGLCWDWLGRGECSCLKTPHAFC